MPDHLEINDLSHLSDEEFHALCPIGEHAPGPEPLSPAAQAVKRDIAQIMQELSKYCRVSISATDVLPITLETNDVPLEAGINALCAAALRAAASQLTSAKAIDRLRAIADELEGVDQITSSTH